MKLQVKTNGLALSEHDRAKLEETVEHLDRLTERYGMRHLHVSVERVGHSKDCGVKMCLALARRRLVVEERAPSLGAAAQRCVDALSHKIELAKERVHRGHGRRAIRRAKDEATLGEAAQAMLRRK